MNLELLMTVIQDFHYNSFGTISGNYDYDSFGYQDLSKVKQHKMFCTMSKFKKFMKRHEIWREAIEKTEKSRYHGRLP